MKISPEGIRLIKSFEGCELQAYQDMVNVWTIGYGHTGSDVHKDLTISQEDANELLASDVCKFEQCVSDCVDIELTQHEFDALVSFAFNLGCGALENSTLLKLLNNGNKEAAAAQFGRWVHAGGKVVKGLIRRREAERDLFCSRETV